MSHSERIAEGAVRVSYWKGNVASDREDADRATLEGARGYNRIEFDRTTIGDGWYFLDQVCRMLERAFEAGKEQKLEELRKFLGVQGPRP